MSFSGSNLTGASFDRAKITQTSFSNANLAQADFSAAMFYGSAPGLGGTTFESTNFAGAYMAGVDFSNVSNHQMKRCNFSEACLVNANFKGIDLSTSGGDTPASFAYAALQGAQLEGANLDGTNLAFAAASTSSGTLEIDGLSQPPYNISQVSYPGATQLPGPDGTNGQSTCPDGSSGPCNSPGQWQNPQAPNTRWRYKG